MKTKHIKTYGIQWKLGLWWIFNSSKHWCQKTRISSWQHKELETLQLKELEKDKHTKPKDSIRKEIIASRTEINEKENGKNREINEIKMLYFLKDKKKTLTNLQLVGLRTQKIQITKIRNNQRVKEGI